MNGDGRVAKRQRVDEPPTPARHTVGSRIFAPYRTIGLVSPTGVPFTSIPLGKTTFQITTSVGRCLHTYDLRRGLQLVFITRPETLAEITATVAWKDRVFAAWGSASAESRHGVWVFHRGKKVAELQPPPGQDEAIRRLLIFGSWIVGCGTNRIEVWRSATFEHYTTITAKTTGGTTSPAFTGHVCHIPTLINKIFAGKNDGSVEIWNIGTGKLVYTLQPDNISCGSVTALEPTPAVYLLAIARADGTVAIHDVRTDKELLLLNSKAARKSPITAMSFRSDELGAGLDGRKAGVLATATLDSGDVTLWDLNDGGRVMGTLYSAHNPPSAKGGTLGGITKVEFLSGQAVMVTTGRDNSLKTWIFDDAPFSPVPRILHSRSGHASGITLLDFLPVEANDADARGKWLMSAGRDHGFWGWSLRRDAQSTELSQGNIRQKHRKLGHVLNGLDGGVAGIDELKAPEISCMATCMNRDAGMNTNTGGGPVWANVASGQKKKDADAPATGWESIVTGHRGDKFARTWFWGRKKAGRWAFETSDGSEVSSVAMSPCGTFALVGSDGGGIDMFNLQSGIHRRKFPSPVTPAQARKQKLQHSEGATSSPFGPGRGRHTKRVTGIVVDNLNRTVISNGMDGKIKFWDFQTGILRHEIDWHPMAAVLSIRYHRSSDLIAVGCDDLSIRVVDIETRRLVRELWGCVGQLRDYCFSNDGRWIVAASTDSVIRVWDLPTGHLIDAMRTESTCTALAFSITGEYLATAHADSIGINLWSNRTLFAHVSTRQINEDEVRRMTLPTASGEGGENMLNAAFESPAEEDEELEDGTPSATIDQLSTELTTLSLVPRTRWQTLLHLDTIAARNKPIEAPKAPEKAPFFLPSLDKLASSKNTNSERHDNENTAANAATSHERSRVAALQRLALPSDSNPFTHLLRDSAPAGAGGALAQAHEPFIAHLASLPPAAADLEIRSLRAPADAHRDVTAHAANERVLFVRALTARLRQRRDYEVVQAWMAVFLRLHGEVVGSDGALREALVEWREVQRVEAARLGQLAAYCGGVVSFLRSAR